MLSLISFTVVYNHDRTGNLRSDGTASVLIRAYQQKRYAYFNSGVYIEPKHWCSKQSRIKEHPRERRLNAVILQKLRQLEEVESKIAYQTGSCSLKQLKANVDSKPDFSFIEFYERELEQERNRIAPSSYKNFRQTLMHLSAFSPKMAFSDINQGLVRSFQNYLFDEGLSHNTVQKHYRFFKKYVRLAVQQQFIPNQNNPFTHMKMGAKKTEITYLTEEEFQLFRNYTPPADKPLWQHAHQLFLFCCYTGIRFCDLCQLTSHSFYETEDGYFMQIAALRKTGKPYLQNIRLLFKEKDSAVSPPEAIIKQLIANPKYTPGKKLCRIVYSNANSYRRILKLIAQELPLRESVQIKIATHTARHTFGTYMASRINLMVLKDLMVHSDIKETMVYVHLSDKRKEEALLNVNW